MTRDAIQMLLLTRACAKQPQNIGFVGVQNVPMVRNISEIYLTVCLGLSTSTSARWC